MSAVFITSSNSTFKNEQKENKQTESLTPNLE